jgi:Ca2+-binding RTX toxin-like protein
MAKLFASSAINYNHLDISGLTDATSSGLDDNVDIVVRGVTYQDVFWCEGAGFKTFFGGTGITASGYVVTGGRVQGVQTEIPAGSDWVEHWLLQGIDVSAVAIYEAAMTADMADDLALISQALAGADRFQLSQSADRMRGFGGNDLMAGNGGNDVLIGDGGNDTLMGGAGQDTLAGKVGADVFDYDRVTDSRGAAADVILDFQRGIDHIDLSGIDANTATAGNSAFKGFINAGATFSRAGQLKFVDGVLYGNTDADAGAEFAIALTGVAALATSDLVL